MAGNVNAADLRQSDWEMYRIHYADEPLPAAWRREEPLPGGKFAVTTTAALQAYKSVLADVGANARLSADGTWQPSADAVDQRVIADVHQVRGEGAVRESNRVHYTDPAEVGGYPMIDAGIPYADADHDGMPDAWERANGFDPQDPSDASGDKDGDGYTNLEEFLAGT